MRIDLQLHSTYSDGYLTPTELAKFVNEKGIKVASLTDHNTIGGTSEFQRACAKYGIKTVPGLELYVKIGGRKLNLLWYNYRDSHELHDFLRETQVRRRGAMRRALTLISEAGLNIDVEKILDNFNHYVPINHVVDCIFAGRGNVQKIRAEMGAKNPQEGDMIRHYFRNPKYSVLLESYVNINRVVALRKRLGGQLILNHPGKFNQIHRDFFAKMKKIGIDGVEVLSPHHSINSVMYAQFLAKEFKFIETGGSDFHKSENLGAPIQNSLDYFAIDSQLLNSVERIIG